jgi:Protein of unknown function (DUF2897)
MGRAIFIILIILGVVVGGLMLLRRTASMRPPEGTRVRKEIKPEDEDEDDSRGW